MAGIGQERERVRQQAIGELGDDEAAVEDDPDCKGGAEIFRGVTMTMAMTMTMSVPVMPVSMVLMIVVAVPGAGVVIAVMLMNLAMNVVRAGRL